MPDYQEMYYIMVRATEKAMRILIEAKQRCEEMVVSEEAAERAETGDPPKETDIMPI